MFENISIGIKTFLRDEHLFNTIHAIQKNFDNAQMIIADCGDHSEEKDGIYADLARDGHHVIQLPFDAGFGVMSNAIVDVLKRPYLLTGSDDFDFAPKSVREGIMSLENTLIDFRNIDIVSGRVNTRPYEFNLLELDGEITEVPLFSIKNAAHENHYLSVNPCDLTVNYSLIRNKVFDTIRWDDDVKIGGGEHGAFFLDCMRAGIKTAYVPYVNINEQQVRNSERYRQFRNRANCDARPCFMKRGVKKYILGDGRVDYQEKQ